MTAEVPIDTTFESFFRSEFQALARLATSIMADPSAGEDLAQEAMCRLCRQWHTLTGHPNRSAWVRRVLTNLCIDELRRRSRRKIDKSAAASAQLRLVASTPRDEHLFDGEVWQAITALSPAARVAIVLFYLEDRSVAEIAELTGVSENNARVQLHRARVQLRSALTSMNRSEELS